MLHLNVWMCTKKTFGSNNFMLSELNLSESIYGSSLHSHICRFVGGKPHTHRTQLYMWILYNYALNLWTSMNQTNKYQYFCPTFDTPSWIANAMLRLTDHWNIQSGIAFHSPIGWCCYCHIVQLWVLYMTNRIWHFTTVKWQWKIPIQKMGSSRQVISVTLSLVNSKVG